MENTEGVGCSAKTLDGGRAPTRVGRDRHPLGEERIRYARSPKLFDAPAVDRKGRRVWSALRKDESTSGRLALVAAADFDQRGLWAEGLYVRGGKFDGAARACSGLPAISPGPSFATVSSMTTTTTRAPDRSVSRYKRATVALDTGGAGSGQAPAGTWLSGIAGREEFTCNSQFAQRNQLEGTAPATANATVSSVATKTTRATCSAAPATAPISTVIPRRTRGTTAPTALSAAPATTASLATCSSSTATPRTASGNRSARDRVASVFARTAGESGEARPPGSARTSIATRLSKGLAYTTTMYSACPAITTCTRQPAVWES